MYEIIIQRAVAIKSIPKSRTFTQWVTAVLQNNGERKLPSAEVTIRIVDKLEITELNSTYRHKNKPTNVLSFPFDMPEECFEEMPILGDIVICAEIILEEAAAQKKAVNAHWAHMVVHGTLHLLGFDHENEADAERMECSEIKILNLLGFSNPYYIGDEGEKR